jgi:2Fe-2S ferredoxin
VPTVVFESADDAPVEVAAPQGGALVDVCDERSAPVAFSCRSASCGTCRVLVLEGVECLEPASAEELEVLALFGDDPRRCRLACQARIRAGTGCVRVRAAP